MPGTWSHRLDVPEQEAHPSPPPHPPPRLCLCLDIVSLVKPPPLPSPQGEACILLANESSKPLSISRVGAPPPCARRHPLSQALRYSQDPDHQETAQREDKARLLLSGVVPGSGRAEFLFVQFRVPGKVSTLPANACVWNKCHVEILESILGDLVSGGV